MEWKYVGESGEEISGRNSHSMHLLTVPEVPESIFNSPTLATRSISVLVIFGGASPELGPLGETYYAILPIPSAIGDCILIFIVFIIRKLESCAQIRLTFTSSGKSYLILPVIQPLLHVLVRCTAAVLSGTA